MSPDLLSYTLPQKKCTYSLRPEICKGSRKEFVAPTPEGFGTLMTSLYVSFHVILVADELICHYFLTNDAILTQFGQIWRASYTSFIGGSSILQVAMATCQG